MDVHEAIELGRYTEYLKEQLDQAQQKWADLEAYLGTVKGARYEALFDACQQAKRERDHYRHAAEDLARSNQDLVRFLNEARAEVEQLRELLKDVNAACAEWKRRAFSGEIDELRQQVMEAIERWHRP